MSLALALALPMLLPLGKVEAAPAMSSNPASPTPALEWPAEGPITTYFPEVGATSPRGHAGLEIGAPLGAAVTAAGAGKVVLAAPASGGYGIEIILDHGHDLQTVYAHLSGLSVEAGEVVSGGEIIGWVGSTGYSTGPHLHFEVHQDSELRDPLDYLSSTEGGRSPSPTESRQGGPYRNRVSPA